jgi:glutaredoxin-like YruB-family protein
MANVVIYSTPSCHFCQSAKDFLNERNIAFTEHDVAEDAQKRQEMVEKTGQMGVPVIMVDDQVMVGFDESKLAELLGVEA